MNRKMISFFTGLSILLLALSGCDSGGDSDSGGSSFSDEVSETLAGATIISGYMPYMAVTDGSFVDGTYGTGDGPIVSGTLVVSGDDTIFTFTDCVLDLSDGEGTFTILVNGSFSYTYISETYAFTLTNLSLTSTEDSSDSATINGSHLVSDTEWDANLTITGVDGSPYTVTLVMTMSGGEPSAVQTATVNGEDFSDEITAFMDEL